MDKPQLKKNSKLIYSAAVNLGLECKVISEQFGLLEICKNEKKILFYFCTSSINSSQARNVVLNKFLSSEILHKYRIPVPESMFIRADNFDTSEIQDFLSRYKNIVVKPNAEYGGHGVTLNIKDMENLKKSIIKASEYGNNIILEKFVTGKNYRILVCMGKILAIVERVPAYIIGNDKDTIQMLIESKNQKRKELGLDQIIIDESLVSLLSISNLSLDTIPDADQKVEVRDVCNLSSGGETLSIDINKIPKESLDMFIQIPKIFNLSLSGIDVIANDIYAPIKNNLNINEVNDSPSMEVHCYTDMNFNLRVPEEVLKIYFDLA